MTLGERIQECRKNAGLSQEALGETMGVTRQSISKWESDTTVPELDKLVALSKLFHIPVGALLGVEEGEALQELTARELAALSAIAEKLTPPAPEQPPKKRWPRAVAAVAAIALILWGVGFSSRMSSLENRLQNIQYDVNDINSDVSRQINGIAQRVEEVLQAQDSITADVGYQCEESDLLAGTVTFRLWAVPKTYQEGMTASFTVDGEAFEGVTVVGSEGTGHRFEALVTGPLVDDIVLSVTFRGGEESRNQIIARESRLLFRSQPEVFFAGRHQVYNVYRVEGVPRLSTMLSFQVESGQSPMGEEIKATDITFYLHRGDELIWTEKADISQAGTNHGGPRLELELKDLREGELFCFSTRYTDSLGREWERKLETLVAQEGSVIIRSNGEKYVSEYKLSSWSEEHGKPWSELIYSG